MAIGRFKREGRKRWVRSDWISFCAIGVERLLWWFEVVAWRRKRDFPAIWLGSFWLTLIRFANVAWRRKGFFRW